VRRRRCVCIESPLSGDYERNVRYADAAMADALKRGEAPFLGHLLYPRVLDDRAPEDRDAGIEAHVSWLLRADAVIAYVDFGITTGMKLAIERALAEHIPVEERSLGEHWDSPDVTARSTRGFR
jgi:hypothetical protein